MGTPDEILSPLKIPTLSPGLNSSATEAYNKRVEDTLRRLSSTVRLTGLDRAGLSVAAATPKSV